MPKIFNISLHRSATLSFIKFCEANGLPSQHWLGRDFDEQVRSALDPLDIDYVWQKYQPYLQKSQAFADVPIPLFYHHAYEAMPDAKFVLLLRSPQSWIKSVRHHCRNRTLDVLEQMQYRFALGKKIQKLQDLTDLELFYGYEEFTETVTCYYVSMRANFLVLDLAQPDLGPSLARFLNFTKVTEFPKIEHSW